MNGRDRLGRTADEAYDQMRDERAYELTMAMPVVDYWTREDEPLPRILTTQELIERIRELTERPLKAH